PEVPRGGRLAPEVVRGATGEIARVLSARDYFSVLGLSPEGAEALSDEAVKGAYRRTQLRVHPDKAGPDAAGAEQASKRVNEAYSLLQTAEARKRLLQQMRATTTSSTSASSAAGAAAAGGGGGGGGTGAAGASYSSASASSAPSPDSVMMHCWRCPDMHEAKLFSMDCSRARFCSECRTHHPAEENDVWIWEDPAAFLFPTRKMLLCLKGVVLDITDMATCCGMFHDPYGKRLPANTHYAQYRIGPLGSGSKGATGGGQFRGRGDKGGKGRKGKRR
ncbi:hypothetical protein Agub_g5761, partial [Astrephomene gubernaculifera]